MVQYSGNSWIIEQTVLAQLTIHLELTELLKHEEITSKWIKDLNLEKETVNLGKQTSCTLQGLRPY